MTLQKGWLLNGSAGKGGTLSESAGKIWSLGDPAGRDGHLVSL